ncbi:MAG: phage head-tail connector protein [Gemmataceae bacterium]|nr:phage head-tail connector protein [Gemmataceae bacterium]
MLDTLDNVKLALPVTGTADDALLTRLMQSAGGYIASYANRDFVGGTFTELHPGGSPLLFLRNFPVAVVTSLKVDPLRQFEADTLRPADGYVLFPDRGVIASLTGPFLGSGGRGDDRPATVQVVYSTPTGAVPPAVKEAFTQLVASWYRQAKTFANSEQQLLVERGDDGRVWSWSLTSGLKIPPTVTALLAPFRVPPA